MGLLYTRDTPYVVDGVMNADVEGAEIDLLDGFGLAVEASWTDGTAAPTGTLKLQGRLGPSATWRDIVSFSTSPAGAASGTLEQFYPLHFPRVRVLYDHSSGGSATSFLTVRICSKPSR